MFNLSTISNPNFIMNAVLHSLILFSFLSVFFYLYISHLTSGAFQDQINSLIESMITKDTKEKIINGIQSFIDTNPNAKYILLLLGINVDDLNNIQSSDKVKYILQRFASITNKPDPTTTLMNKSLFSLILIINIMIWIFYVILCTMFSVYDSNFHIFEIIIENLIIFIFIGIIEFLFFTKIAFKFIPVLPSYITTEFLTLVKDKIRPTSTPTIQPGITTPSKTTPSKTTT